MNEGSSRAGFTLIECLVALAVFGLAAMALLNLSGESTRSAARVETRTLGGIVADNVAAEAMIARARRDKHRWAGANGVGCGWSARPTCRASAASTCASSPMRNRPPSACCSGRRAHEGVAQTRSSSEPPRGER
jgi:type II secretion system protein I